jgi:hypothetical protein
MSFWLTSWEDVNNLAQSVALVAGGGWALWRFGLTRESRTFLDLSASARVVDGSADSALAVVTVQMKNIGAARIDARTVRKGDGTIFNDGFDRCLHAATLKVRRIPDYQAPAQFDWYVLPPLPAEITTLNRHVQEPLEEVNYLADFNEVKNDGSVELDFWLEPDTTYEASVPLRLPRGNYAIKTFFIGRLDTPHEQEYWSHLTVFRCDEPPRAS